MSQGRSSVSAIESTSHNMALFPPNPNFTASQFAPTLRPLATVPHACPLASGRVGRRVSRFLWRGLISITRSTRLLARGGASVTGRAHFFRRGPAFPRKAGPHP
jgi:hypothetical protein